MKLLAALATVLLTQSGWALELTEAFVGPIIGSTSYSTSSGTDNRDSQFTFGGEAAVFFDRLGAGLKYSRYQYNTGGTQSVQVQQENQWLDGEFKFIALKPGLYAEIGAGPVFQAISTKVYSQTENNYVTLFASDVGIGNLLRFNDVIAIDLSVKYYQYSSVNGFLYAFSLGYSPTF